MSIVENLDDFNGWEENDIDLFSEQEELEIEENNSDETEKPLEKEETVEEESSDEEKPVKDDKGDKPKKEDFFQEQEQEDEEEPLEKEEAPKDDSRNILNYLLKKEYIDLEDDIDVDKLDDKDIEDLIEEKLDSAIDNGVDEVIKGLPDVVKNIVKYTANNGNPYEIINHIAKIGSASDNIDLDDELAQEAIVRQKMQSEGYDSDEINVLLENLKKSNKLKDRATKYFNNIKAAKEEEQKRILAEQELEKRKQLEALKANKKELDEFVNNNDSIGDITLSRKDKRELSSYVYDRNIKLQNGNTISNLQKDLFYDVINNKKALMQLAVLMRSRNEDGTFNFDNVKTKVQTEVSKHIKNNLRRSNNEIPTETINRRSKKIKSLTEYFD